MKLPRVVPEQQEVHRVEYSEAYTEASLGLVEQQYILTCMSVHFLTCTCTCDMHRLVVVCDVLVHGWYLGGCHPKWYCLKVDTIIV